MLFARLALPQIADDIDLRSESLLKNLQAKFLGAQFYFSVDEKEKSKHSDIN
jgi:poly(A) polymerase Pap1